MNGLPLLPNLHSNKKHVPHRKMSLHGSKSAIVFPELITPTNHHISILSPDKQVHNSALSSDKQVHNSVLSSDKQIRNSILSSDKQIHNSILSSDKQAHNPIIPSEILIQKPNQPMNHNKRVHRKMIYSQSSCPAFVLKEQLFQVVQVRIFSNWGHPNEISLSSILLLDSNKVKIPVFKTVISNTTKINCNFDYLYNGILGKTNRDEILILSWPPIESDYILITFLIEKNYSFYGIRLWNQNFEPESGARLYELYYADEFSFKGEVPINFGINHYLLLNQMKTIVYSPQEINEIFFSKDETSSLVDNFGKYPIEKIKQIKFILICNFNNEPEFGLNAVELFNINNKKITANDIEDIQIKNCTQIERVDCLLKEEHSTNDMQEMFYAKARNWTDPPEIDIIFKHPTIVRALTIYNYNSEEPSLDAGIKYIKIKSEKRILWIGKLNKARGAEKIAKQDFKTITFMENVQRKSKSPKKMPITSTKLPLILENFN